MTPLYSLRTEIDHDSASHYRITKFVDGEVESSYLVGHDACECPAGHRHTCRHRQMLPQMLAHGIANTHWFFAFDMGGAIVDFNGTPKRLFDELAALPKLPPLEHDLVAKYNDQLVAETEDALDQHCPQDTAPQQRTSWRRL